MAILKGKQTKGYGIFTDPDGDPAIKSPDGKVYKCAIKRYGKAGEGPGGYIALFYPDGADCQHGLRLKLKETGFFIERLFSWLDTDNDGFITIEELAVHLYVPVGEARLLVEEVHQAVKKKDTRAKIDRSKMTKEDFKILFEQQILADKDKKGDNIPDRIKKRYKSIFETIDTTKVGTITFDQLATNLGMEQDEANRLLAELHMDTKQSGVLDFQEFSVLLHNSADKNRAGRAFKQLFSEADETQTVMNALAENMRFKDQDKGGAPPKKGLSKMEKRMSRRQLRTNAGLEDPSDKVLDKVIPGLDLPPPVGEDDEEAEDTDIPPLVQQVWAMVDAGPDGTASSEDVMQALHSMGHETLGISADAFEALPFELLAAADEQGRLDVTALWDCLPIYNTN